MHQHVDAVSGSILGAVAGLSQATGAVAVPEGAPWWAGYLASLAIALAPLVIRGLQVWRAGGKDDKPTAPDCPPSKDPPK
jgi:hypothetical protein